MCGTRLKNGWFLLVALLLLALPGYSWAKGSAEESNVEQIEEKQENSYMVSESELMVISNETETLSNESARLRTLVETLEAQRTKLAKEVDGLNLLLNESGERLEISLEETKRLETILNKTVPIIAVSSGIGIFLIGGLIGGLIHSAIQ